MANGRFHISSLADERLTELMVLLDIKDNRPLALRIALSKGLLQSETYYEGFKTDKGREIPDRVVWSGLEYTLFAHLIREKEQAQIPLDQEMDKRFQFYIEKGLEIIAEEMKQLSSTENYLLSLLGTAPSNHVHSTPDDKEIEDLADLAGL
jgi:hypothetical protein